MSVISVETVIYAIILMLVVFTFATIVWYTLKNGMSPMPTGPRIQRAILDVLSRIQRDGVVVELGSGWGTLALGVARKNSDLRVVGFENSPVPYWISRLLCYVMLVPNLAIKRRNFYDMQLPEADVVICYLFSGAMERLREKFETELSADTWVISHTFDVPGWEPERVIEVRDLYRTKVYVYRR